VCRRHRALVAPRAVVPDARAAAALSCPVRFRGRAQAHQSCVTAGFARNIVKLCCQANAIVARRAAPAPARRPGRACAPRSRDVRIQAEAEAATAIGWHVCAGRAACRAPDSAARDLPMSAGSRTRFLPGGGGAPRVGRCGCATRSATRRPRLVPRTAPRPRSARYAGCVGRPRCSHICGPPCGATDVGPWCQRVSRARRAGG
jgi:hypothetical protein